jgi:prophage regulatory protein
LQQEEAGAPLAGDDQLLRLPEVLKLFPVSRATWYKGVKEGHFPPPVKLTARAVAWRKSDITALLVRLSGSKDDK